MQKLLDKLNALVEQHKFFRRLTLTLAIVICGWTTYQMFVDITAQPSRR